MMPGMDGFHVAQKIRQDPHGVHVPIIMVTALSGKEDRLRAVEAGSNDFISKPFDRTELRVRTERARGVRLDDLLEEFARGQPFLGSQRLGALVEQETVRFGCARRNGAARFDGAACRRGEHERERDYRTSESHSY